MTKKPRNALTELVSQFSFDDLAPESTEKPKSSSSSKQESSPKASKKRTQKTEDKVNLLEKLKQQSKTETTRITLDLDPDTYEQLNQLAEYTEMTKAKLLRALIQEMAKLLQKIQ
ncbi:ribbon-helix-helix protein, CopG family [Nostoc sp. FACHB-190]|uniref:ribbon-helix-helix protein, CopG family n=1 Tax=Nostoc sp. FACHB-190 TaxID=2692838 RepID=UPI0016888B3D|nr:ribbon-helix-helix protein, CopG family [Nostoc sp. FACHB-190]MBD2303837.1 ribbon-helix-helix protein, CopG family [Nostoc sp. FACHB-190]